MCDILLILNSHRKIFSMQNITHTI